MRRLRFLVNSIILLVPLLFLGIGATRLVQSVFHYLNTGRRLAGTISAEATRALGREVRVGDVHITGNLWSLSAANRVDLFDVSVANGARVSDGELAHARSVSVWYNLEQVLADEHSPLPLVDEIFLDAPDILLERTKAGHWNYQDLIKPRGPVKRSFTDKISVTNGAVHYVDAAFPHPAGVPERTLDTRLQRVRGIVLIRPEKSFAFDISAVAEPAYMRDFRATGTVVPSPLRVEARLLANQATLPAIVERLVPAEQLRLSGGHANLDIGVLYVPPVGTSPRRLDTSALIAHGTMQVFDASGRGKMVDAPVDHLNALATFTTDSVVGNLDANYAGMPVHLEGAALGLTLPPIWGGEHTARPIVPPSVSLRGKLARGDWDTISRLAFVRPIVDKLPQQVRLDLRSARFHDDVDFQVSGRVDNPNAEISGHMSVVQYHGYRGDDVDVRATYADRTLRAAVKGRYAGGDAVLSGKVALDDTGKFEAQAQGRGLDISRLGAPIPAKVTGHGRIDFAITGQKRLTPNITAQAEITDATVNGQAIRHVIAQADTVGPDLVVRTLTADDPKGFFYASGTIGMKSKAIDIAADADEMNFAAIARALQNKPTNNGQKGSGGKEEAGSALGHLADAKGLGYARAHLTGTLDSPRLAGQLFAFGVQLGAVEMDKVSVPEFSLTRDALTFKSVASRYPGQVHISGTVLEPFAQTAELNLETRVDSLDLDTLLKLAGVNNPNLVVTGSVSTDNIPVRGTPSSPQTPDFFTANLQDASINDIPIRAAALTMRYQAEGILIKNASAIVAGGLVVGSGWLPFDGPISFTVHGGGLALQPLEEATYLAAPPDHLPIAVRGDFNFDAAIAGTLKEPAIQVQSIKTNDLYYNTFDIGRLTDTASYADHRLRVDSLQLTGPGRTGTDTTASDPKDGVVSISGLTYDLNSKVIATDPGHPIQFDAIPIERIHTLAYSLLDSSNDDLRRLLDDLRDVTGPVNATVAVKGTLDEPQADITWNATNIKARSYEITAWTGSAHVDKNRLIMPSPATPNLKFRIESPYVDVLAPSDSRVSNIVVEFDRDGRRGRISTILRPDVKSAEPVPADVSLSNINLEFLQQVIDKAYTAKIEGQGDIGITAQGRTTSPDLEFTANLRKVAIYRSLDPKASPITLDHVDLLQGMVKEGEISVGSLRAIKNDAVTGMPYETSVSGKLTGFTYEPPFFPPEAALTVKGTLPVAFIALAVPGVLRNTSRGVIDVNAEVKSLRRNPIVTGEIALNVPRLEFASTSTGIQDLIATLKLNNDRLSIADFSAHTYVYGRPKDEDTDLTEVKTPAAPSNPRKPAKPAPVRPARVVAKAPSVSEIDPKRRGSEIRLSGSLPLGFLEARATGPNDGIVVRIFDASDPTAGLSGPPSATDQKPAKNAKQPALTFNENPLPGSRNGVFRGTVRTDPARQLRILGAATEPVLSGRIVLYNAYVTPPAEQKPGTFFALPILPTFDLALALGPNVSVHTNQLDARLATNKDIVARGQIVQNSVDVNVDGTVRIVDGKLKLPAATFTILPGATLHVNYPTPEAGEKVLGLDVDLKAQGHITATSQAGVRKRYEVTVTARGPLTGNTIDPATGRSNLVLNFETNPNDLANSQQLLTERLAGAIIGVDSLDQAGRNPGQAFANVFSSVLSGSVLPGIFDRTATSLGFEELSLGYDPIDRLTLNISRNLFGPLYISYFRTLSSSYQRYDLKLSLRFKDRYQLSFDIDEQSTKKLLLEGVWKF